MPAVNLELLFPLSRMVEPKARGRVRVIKDILPGESVASFLTRLVGQHRGLQSVFDVEKQELGVAVVVIVNDSVLTSSELLWAKLEGDDNVCIMPQHVGG